VKKFIYLALLFLVQALVYAQNKPDSSYSIVDQMPEFNGDLFRYLGDNIDYPKTEQDNDISGIVYVSFIVEKDGSVSTVKVVKGVANGPGLDAEAIRVISGMPRWKPGKENGVTERVQFTLPIHFELVNMNDHDTTVYSLAQLKKPPVFSEGDPAAYVIDKLKAQIKPEIKSGTVSTSFVIEKKGNVSQVSILSGLNPDINAKVIDCIRNMGQWKAGLRKRKYVRVKYFLTIDFGSLPNK
jgi:TonB family protein